MFQVFNNHYVQYYFNQQGIMPINQFIIIYQLTQRMIRYQQQLLPPTISSQIIIPILISQLFTFYMISQQIIIRVRSPAGLNRVSVTYSETFGDLRGKISKALNVPPQDFALFSEDGKSLKLDDRTRIKDINILKNGSIVEVRLLKAPSKMTNSGVGVNVDTIIQEKVNPRCNHPTGGRCLNCLPAEKKPDEKAPDTGKPAEFGKTNPSVGQKCSHGPGGKCFNCVSVPTGKDQVKQKCNHGPGTKCLHCYDQQFINNVAHVSFDHWLAEKKLKCKGVHAADVKCNNCLPPTEQRYKVDATCKNHEPYPKAMCNKCLPPAVTIARQPYRHLDYVQFMNVKDLSNFIRNWVEHKHQAEQRVAYLYGYYAEDPHYKGGIRGIVEAIYEPNQKGSYNSFELLPDPHLHNVEEIAKCLGLERIGWMITETNHDTFLSQPEVRMACQLQDEFSVRHSTGYPISNFFTVVMRSDEKGTGEIKPEVYMISDQGQALQKQGMFVHSETRKMMKIRPRANEKDVLPSFICSGKTVTEFQPEFLIVNIAHGSSPDNRFSIVKNADFPAYSRKKIEKNDLKTYMQKYKQKPAYLKYGDFNLLIYLADEFDLETACTLAYSVAAEEKTSQAIIDQMIENKAGL